MRGQMHALTFQIHIFSSVKPIKDYWYLSTVTREKNMKRSHVILLHFWKNGSAVLLIQIRKTMMILHPAGNLCHCVRLQAKYVTFNIVRGLFNPIFTIAITCGSIIKRSTVAFWNFPQPHRNKMRQ